MAVLQPDGGEEDVTTCAVCDTVLEEAPNRRTLPSVVDGQVVHDDFCSERCLRTWKD